MAPKREAKAKAEAKVEAGRGTAKAKGKAKAEPAPAREAPPAKARGKTKAEDAPSREAPPAKAKGKAKADEAPSRSAPPAKAPLKRAAPEEESAPMEDVGAVSGLDYSSWPAPKLKARLQELGISASGTRSQLIDRLKACEPDAAPKASSAKRKAEEPSTSSPKRGKVEPKAEAKAKAKAKTTSAEPKASQPPPKLEAATQVFFEDGEFTAGYATSNRSTCQRCKEKIDNGAFRISKLVQSEKFDGKQSLWHHATCFLEGGLLPRCRSMIDGYSALRPEHQDEIAQKVPHTKRGEDAANPALQAQSKRVFEIKDALKELSDNQLKEMLELNDYPTKKFYVSSTPADLCADGILFGATGRCEVCKDSENEKEGGHVLLDGEKYRCTGFVNEFLKCTFQTQTPSRSVWTLSDRAKAISKLKSLKLKTGKRLFETKLSDVAAASSSLSSSETQAKPPLFGLHIAVEVNDDGESQRLKDYVQTHGGAICEIAKATTCVVSTAQVANVDEEDEASFVATAKACFVPGVSEAFLTACVEAGAQVDMTPHLLWGDARKLREALAEVETTKLIEKMGVQMDADVGDLFEKAHVLVEKKENRVYSEMMNCTDLVSGANSYYTMHLLESDDSADRHYWVFRKWGRVGVKLGGKKIEEFGSNREKAIAAFAKLYLDKTGNSFGHKPSEFVCKTGKFTRVDITHKALMSKKALAEAEAHESGGSSMAGPLLSKPQIEKADKVLDRIEALLAASDTPGVEAKFMAASAEYYSLIPHNFGLSKPPSINHQAILEKEKALLLFYLRMGFEEMGGEEEEKLAPIAGVMECELKETLAETCVGVCNISDVKKCVTKGKTMDKSKAGKPIKPMTAELYGSILLYTSNAIYKQLNKALRDEDRDQVSKYFLYLRMLFEACARLPVRSCTLWRGIGVDLMPVYKVGSTITWWGVSSCTSDQKVAQEFANSCGDQSTFLTIETKTACNITEVSFFSNEAESLLLPGTQLLVVSAERKGKQAHIRLREVGRAVG